MTKPKPTAAELRVREEAAKAEAVAAAAEAEAANAWAATTEAESEAANAWAATTEARAKTAKDEAEAANARAKTAKDEAEAANARAKTAKDKAVAIEAKAQAAEKNPESDINDDIKRIRGEPQDSNAGKNAPQVVSLRYGEEESHLKDLDFATFLCLASKLSIRRMKYYHSHGVPQALIDSCKGYDCWRFSGTIYKNLCKERSEFSYGYYTDMCREATALSQDPPPTPQHHASLRAASLTGQPHSASRYPADSYPAGQPPFHGSQHHDPASSLHTTSPTNRPEVASQSASQHSNFRPTLPQPNSQSQPPLNNQYYPVSPYPANHLTSPYATQHPAGSYPAGQTLEYSSQRAFGTNDYQSCTLAPLVLTFDASDTSLPWQPGGYAATLLRTISFTVEELFEEASDPVKFRWDGRAFISLPGISAGFFLTRHVLEDEYADMSKIVMVPRSVIQNAMGLRSEDQIKMIILSATEGVVKKVKLVRCGSVCLTWRDGAFATRKLQEQSTPKTGNPDPRQK